MNEPAHCDGVVDARVVALRVEGVDGLEPVRFHYIAALAQRATAHQGRVKRILDAKVDAAVAALRQRLQQAQGDSVAALTTAHATTAQHETLGDLVRHMAQQTPASSGSAMLAAPMSTTPRSELKSVAYFRNTWSRLSAEKQVTQALGLAPKNAGPINSHVVALRSLALMRDTSPDYLNRFMSYVDTLMCLDQSDKPTAPPARVPRSTKTKP